MADNQKLRDFGLLLIRVALAMVMIHHGAQKLFGLFGGKGLVATLEGFQAGMGIPQWLGMLAVIAEFFGGLGLAVGLLTRLAAFGVFVTMAVAAFTHIQKGDSFAGFEFPLALALVALGIMATGAGQFAVEAMFKKKRR